MPFKQVRLNEIAAGGGGGLVDGPFGSNLPATAYVDFGVPVIRGSNLSKGRFRFRDEGFVFVSQETADKLSRSACQPGDIIFTKKGTLGQVGIVPFNSFQRYLLSSNQMRLRVDNGLANPEYVYYALACPDAIDKVIRESEHTGVPKINLEYIRQFPILLPDRATQNEVALFLRAIDERLQLFEATNTTLESIARAIFKSWFIDFDPVRAKVEDRDPDGMDEATAALFPSEFAESELGLIPKGWQPGTFGDIAINYRRQVRPEDLAHVVTYIGLEHMPRRSIAVNEAGTSEGLESGKFLFERDDILFGKLRPYFHKVGLAPCSGVCSTDILVLRPSATAFHAFVAMHASSEAMIEYTTRLSNGAKMPRTSWHDVAAFRVALPPKDIADAFAKLAKGMFERIYANIEAARTLGELRGTLLPRLISGKLTIPEAEELVQEAIT